MTLVKNVDGLYDADPSKNPSANFIDEISVAELEKKNIATLPFDESLIKILKNARLIKQFQIVNGLKPELIQGAINGEHVGTIIHNS